MRLVVEVFVVQPFAENTYLVGDADAGAAIVIDPGGRADEIVRAAERHGLIIEAIVNTHAHIDHVSGVAALQALLDVPFLLHAEAEPTLERVPAQARQYGFGPLDVPKVDRHLVHGERIDVGGLTLEVRDTPGHAPGHVTLVSSALAGGPDGTTAAPMAFVGDVIFRGSIGRVDLPGGDYATLMRSIEREILVLPDDTMLYNGHGPATTVGHERATNPFVLDWQSGRPRWERLL